MARDFGQGQIQCVMLIVALYDTYSTSGKNSIREECFDADYVMTKDF